MTPSGQPSAIHCRTSSCRALIGAVRSIAKDSITASEAQPVHLPLSLSLNAYPFTSTLHTLIRLTSG